MKSVRLSLLMCAILTVGLVFYGCASDDDNPSNPTVRPHYEDGEGDIGDDGGIVEDGDDNSPTHGAFVDIPEGCLLYTSPSPRD